MKRETICFDAFMATVEPQHQIFIQDLHDFLIENGCKVEIEEKRSGMLASFKHVKLKKSIINLLFRKKGMLVRIYGENAHKYAAFLNELPSEMLQSIQKAGICKRLVNGTCSPKCCGYDFILNGEHMQKCKFGCFEFLISNENSPHIRAFIENEMAERTAEI
jgi:hypothetical protein